MPDPQLNLDVSCLDPVQARQVLLDRFDHHYAQSLGLMAESTMHLGNNNAWRMKHDLQAAHVHATLANACANHTYTYEPPIETTTTQVTNEFRLPGDSKVMHTGPDVQDAQVFEYTGKTPTNEEASRIGALRVDPAVVPLVEEIQSLHWGPEAATEAHRAASEREMIGVDQDVFDRLIAYKKRYVTTQHRSISFNKIIEQLLDDVDPEDARGD